MSAPACARLPGMRAVCSHPPARPPACSRLPIGPPTHPPASAELSLPAWICRDKELAAVKVQPGDVDLIAAEFEIDRKKAELRLRECGGDVRAALASFLQV